MNSKLIFNRLAMVCGILFLAACTSTPAITVQPATTLDNPQVAAIQNIRMYLDMPDLPLASKGTDRMTNSPNGDLTVSLYTDSEGRKFFVEPQTNTVVEIDARDLLSSIPADAPSKSQDELRTRAMKIARATTPNFDALLPNLTDNSGGKVDNYFFDLRKPISAGESMPPFFQIGFHKSGFIFAYINTLAFK
jgi:hypothetical protein